MSRTWFASDLHFGHRNIITYCNRPFWTNPPGVICRTEPDIEAMNKGIIDRWNALVAPDDTVWVVGDVALGKIAETLPLCRLLMGTKFLVPGNHDRMWPHGKNPARWVAEYEAAGFIIKPLIQQVAFGSRSFCVSHLPYTGDSHDEDRWESDRPKDRGEWLIHGHVHDTWRQKGRMINVGIDAWGGDPVSLDQILALVDAGPQELGPIQWLGLE